MLFFLLLLLLLLFLLLFLFLLHLLVLLHLPLLLFLFLLHLLIPPSPVSVLRSRLIPAWSWPVSSGRLCPSRASSLSSPPPPSSSSPPPPFSSSPTRATPRLWGPSPRCWRWPFRRRTWRRKCALPADLSEWKAGDVASARKGRLVMWQLPGKKS